MHAKANQCSAKPNENLIEVNMLKFINLLRRKGVRVSSAETLDALAALTYIDIGQREEVKAALAATLVKQAEQMELFEQAFDNFFIPETARNQLTEKHQNRLDEQAELIEKAQCELQFQGEELELTEEENLAYSEMTDAERERLQEFIKQTSQGKKVDKKFKPIVESLVKGHIQRWKNNNKYTAMELESTGDEYLDAVMSELMLNQPEEASLLHQDMGDISSEDIPKMNRVIRRLSRRMATRISRRYESSKHSRHVDIRKTIRANLRYGGIPMDLKYRQKRIKKPDLMLLCDVSGSMNRYSMFTILFVAGLWSVVSKVQLFLFSEDLERVNITHNNAASVEKFAYQLQQESKIWGEGTNLDLALTRLKRDFPTAVGSNTVVIVISDTKTLQPGRAADKLKRMGSQAREIVWLNPMPREQWSRHQSTKMFEKHSKMYLCNTLAQLEEVFSRKLLS